MFILAQYSFTLEKKISKIEFEFRTFQYFHNQGISTVYLQICTCRSLLGVAYSSEIAE